MASLDTNTGAKRARETREHAGLAVDAPIACLLTFVEVTMEVPVVIAVLPPDIAGCCLRKGERTILWVNGTHPPARQRFTLAHELGHLRCDHDGKIPVETFKTLGGKNTHAREVQANAFAAELLAPKAAVVAWAEGRSVDLDAVLELAGAFRMSAIAALYRLNSLGLVPEDYEALQATILDKEQELVVPAQEPDGIAAIAPADLPRLSPVLAGSGLAAIRHGAASTEAVAHALGCDANALATSAGVIGI